MTLNRWAVLAPTWGTGHPQLSQPGVGGAERRVWLWLAQLAGPGRACICIHRSWLPLHASSWLGRGQAVARTVFPHLQPLHPPQCSALLCPSEAASAKTVLGKSRIHGSEAWLLPKGFPICSSGHPGRMPLSIRQFVPSDTYWVQVLAECWGWWKLLRVTLVGNWRFSAATQLQREFRSYPVFTLWGTLPFHDLRDSGTPQRWL